jgi:iron complex outermembrane recepter protein
MRSYSILLCAGAAPVLLATPVFAQTVTSSTQAAPNAAAVEEIIVTAQRRSEDIQKVPAAVTAITGSDLQARGIANTDQLQFAVPSMQVGVTSDVTSITIRGVGLNSGNSPAVAVNIDGVYEPRGFLANLSQEDMAQVEVLRGPQGTLYGRNSTGGVVNYISEAPGSTFGGYLLGSYATYNESNVAGAVNLPINDNVRTRVFLDWDDQRDGFVKNVLPGGQDVDRANTLLGRYRLTADLARNFTIDVNLTGEHRTGPVDYFTLHNKPDAVGIASVPLNATAIVPTAPWLTSDNNPVTSDLYYGIASVTLAWKISDDLQLKSITAYQGTNFGELRDDDGLNLSEFPGEYHLSATTVTQEVDLNATAGRIDLVTGGFFMHDVSAERLHYFLKIGYLGLPPNSNFGFNTSDYTTNSEAGFADATAHVTDRFRLIAGIRYSQDAISQTQQNFLSFGPTPYFYNCPYETNNVTYSSVTDRAGAQFDVTQDSHLYATYSTGFKAGGFNVYACDNNFKPEQITSYEVGLKNRFLGGALVLDLDAFYYNYVNLQLNQVIGVNDTIQNAAGARVEGVEAESEWRPESHITLNGSLSLLDAKFTNFLDTDVLDPQLGVQQLAGRSLQNAPKVSLNFGAAYRTDPILAGGRVTARADISYRSAVSFAYFDLPLDTQTPYTVLNANLIWDSPDDRYQVRLFGTNLLNSAYIESMLESAAQGSRLINWGSPRQVGLELKTKF